MPPPPKCSADLARGAVLPEPTRTASTLTGDAEGGNPKSLARQKEFSSLLVNISVSSLSKISLSQGYTAGGSGAHPL